MGFAPIARRSIPIAVWMVAALAARFATEAWSQPHWRPEKAVEIVLPTVAMADLGLVK